MDNGDVVAEAVDIVLGSAVREMLVVEATGWVEAAFGRDEDEEVVGFISGFQRRHSAGQRGRGWIERSGGKLATTVWTTDSRRPNKIRRDGGGLDFCCGRGR